MPLRWYPRVIFAPLPFHISFNLRTIAVNYFSVKTIQIPGKVKNRMRMTFGLLNAVFYVSVRLLLNSNFNGDDMDLALSL